MIVPVALRKLRFGARIAAIAFVPFVLASSAAAQTLGQGSDVEISIWRVLLAFLLCAALAAGAAFILKARQGSGHLVSFLVKQNRRLRLVESLRLGHQADLCIVECDGRELLVAVSPHGTRLLTRLPLPDENTGGKPEEQV